MSPPVSRLSVRQIELWVFLGWPKEERQEKQRVLLDIDFTFISPPSACDTDQLDDTVCYAELIEKLDHYLQTKECKLLEHLGKIIYDFIKSLYPASSFLIHITKFPAISNLLNGACFTYGDHLAS
jgi:dihydroneopterin aldolase